MLASMTNHIHSIVNLSRQAAGGRAKLEDCSLQKDASKAEQNWRYRQILETKNYKNEFKSLLASMKESEEHERV